MKHLLRRISFYLVALWASITINFIIPRLAPGDPGRRAHGTFPGTYDSPGRPFPRTAVWHFYHDPLWMQYFQYLNNLFHGNLGTSFTYFPTPVSTVLAQELPWTLALVGRKVLISYVGN